MGQELATAAAAGSGVNFQLNGTFNSEGQWEGSVNVNGNIGMMPFPSMIQAIGLGGHKGHAGLLHSRETDLQEIIRLLNEATSTIQNHGRGNRGPRVREVEATEQDIEDNTIIIKYRQRQASLPDSVNPPNFQWKRNS